MVVRRPNNLFNPYTVIRDKELGDSGQLLDKSDWFVSDYINVSELSSVVISGKSGGQTNAFFNANKQFISQTLLAEGTVSVPSGAVYLRINAPITSLNTTAVTSSTPHTSQVTDLYVKQQTTKHVRAVVSRPVGSTENKINYFNCGPTIKNIDNYDPNAFYPNGVQYNIFFGNIGGFRTLYRTEVSTSRCFLPPKCWGYCIPVAVQTDIGAIDPTYTIEFNHINEQKVVDARFAISATYSRKNLEAFFTIYNYVEDRYKPISACQISPCDVDENSEDLVYIYLYMNAPTTDKFVHILFVYAKDNGQGQYTYYSTPGYSKTKISINTYPQLKYFFNADVNYVDEDTKPDAYPFMYYVTRYAMEHSYYIWQRSPTRNPHSKSITVSISGGRGSAVFTPEGSDIEIESATAPGTFGVNVSATYNKTTKQIRVDVTNAAGSSSVDCVVKYTSI